MARAFKRRGDVYIARLDPAERGVIVGLMEQVLEIIAPPEPVSAPGTSGEGADEFDSIVAGLGGLGMGVSLASGDQDGGAAVRGARGAAGVDDPALGRLLPDANREDPEAAAEFRRLTEDTLRTRKSANLTSAIDSLSVESDSRITMTRDQALATMVALTDVRLVLGERLGLRTDEDADLIADALSAAADDDPMVYAMAVYDFLTWLQESLAHALTP